MRIDFDHSVREWHHSLLKGLHLSGSGQILMLTLHSKTRRQEDLLTVNHLRLSNNTDPTQPATGDWHA